MAEPDPRRRLLFEGQLGHLVGLAILIAGLYAASVLPGFDTGAFLGIFRWAPNAMYVFGFFLIWIPAFAFRSVAALAAAAFSHTYIWVHYCCTEKPDMRRIYGQA